MKKTKLEKLTAIKKNLENRLIKLNNESFRIQGILLKNALFFKSVENALKNGWASNTQEKNYWLNLLFKAKDGDEDSYWLNLLFKAKDGDEDSLKLLRAEFKYNENFKSKTGAFKNV